MIAIARGIPPSSRIRAGSGMPCPGCGAPKSMVIDGRRAHLDYRRRRVCSTCGLRFTTYERVELEYVLDFQI